MRGCLGGVAALCLVFCCVAMESKAADGPIVAVFGMEDKGSGLDKKVLDNLIEYLSAKLTEGGYQVVPPGRILDRLKGQKRRSYKACYDQSCHIEIGRELAAQRSLATKILRIGDTCQVTAMMYNLRRATTETAATAGAPCEVNSLLKAINQISSKLCQPLKKAKEEADRGLARFEQLKKKAESEKAELERMKKAWEIVSKIAKDNQLPKRTRIRALEDFMAEFREESTYLSEAKKIFGELNLAELIIQTVPDKAIVSIAGKEVGPAPVNQKLKSGEYKLMASKNGYQNKIATVRIKYGKAVSVVLKLEPIAGKAPPTVSSSAKKTSGFMTYAPWIALSVTVVAGGTGAVLAGLASSDASAAREEFEGTSKWKELRDSSESMSLGADILFGVAGAAAVGTVILLIIGYGEPEASVSVVPTHGGGAASFSVRF